jgi:beta-phosphoglucomutase
MKKCGVIFDMDGVIIDSEPVYQSLNKEIFKQLGIEVEDWFQLEYIGVTRWMKWQLLKERYHLQESIDELLEIQNRIFSQTTWDYQSLLFSEVIPLLEKLQSFNISIALASSTERCKVNIVLEQCGLKGYFKETITGDEVVKGKPDPEIFLAAAKKLKLPPVRCIVIEDSFNGLLAAKRANMYGIGIRHQNIKVDLSIADQIVDSLAEIDVEL